MRRKNKTPVIINTSSSIKQVVENFDPHNINWDDKTICALCGKQEDCECVHYKCPCGKREVDCEWPESIYCPCRICEKKYAECVCDKPKDLTFDEWLEVKASMYNMRHDWNKEYEELYKGDEDDE